MATNKRLLPIGIQDFPDIRERGFVYVDKTACAYELITGSGKAFFLMSLIRRRLTSKVKVKFFKSQIFFRRKASPSIDSSGAKPPNFSQRQKKKKPFLVTR